MRLLRVQERRATSTSLENVFFFICSRPRRPRVLCHGTDWTGPAPCDCHTALFALHLHQGGGRIRAFCDLQAWTAEKRWVEKSHNGSKFNRLLTHRGRQGAWYFFHHSMYGQLPESGPPDGVIWCTATRGAVAWLCHRQRRCCGLLPRLQPHHGYQQHRGLQVSIRKHDLHGICMSCVLHM